MTEHLVLSSSSSSSENWKAWDELVDRSPLGTLYHRSSWLVALALGMHQDIRVHAVLQEGTFRAGAVLRYGKRYGIRVGRKPWATAYNGIVRDENADPLLVGELLDRLSREYHYTRLVHSPGTDGETVSRRGWTVQERATSILSLSDLDRLWQSFDRRVRQRVRKAEAAGVGVGETSEAGVFFDLYRLTYERQGLPLKLEKGEVVAAIEAAVDSGSVKVFLATTSHGDPAAALVVGADSKRAYFMLAGSHPVHRKTDAATLLWWNVMQRYAQTHREVDLVGHGVETIDRFKRSFSPRLVPHPETIRYSAGLGGQILRVSDWANRHFPRMWAWLRQRGRGR